MRTLDDHSGVVLDCHQGGVAKMWKAFKAGVNSVAISADGKRLVSGSGCGLVKIWNAETGEVSSFMGVPYGWRGDGGVFRDFRACSVLEVF